MVTLKRIVAMVLATSMIACLSACDDGGSQKPTSGTVDIDDFRQEYVTSEQEWSDTDGDFDVTAVDWNGPSGYVIVIPSGDTSIKKAAEVLQEYFKTKANVTLQITTDASAAKSKEILIGKTKRNESNKDIKENVLKVSVNDNKLVFDGGHGVTVLSAVEKFCRLDYEKGKANTFEVKTDFATSPAIDGMDDYKYVWGDEFEGDEIDFTKWSFGMHMYGTGIVSTSSDKDVAEVKDGRLQLRAIRYFDPDKEGVGYKVPISLTTEKNMNYIYGYAEIRSRMPFFIGAWPGFWGKSTDKLSSKYGVKRIQDYFVEIDIFEVFGTPDTVQSNIHKWYQNPKVYDYAKATNSPGISHTQWSDYGNEKDVWKGNPDTINQEYHTYGYEWTPSEIVMYVDGDKVMTYDITKSFDKNDDMRGFHDPMFLMFNNHVTSYDASFDVGMIDENIDKLPSEFCIDYFRLYQKNDGKSKIFLDDTENIYANRK